MPNELFSRTEVDFGGGFHAQFGLIAPNGHLTGMLMQNLGVQYGQNVTRLYEIGTANKPTRVYYVTGRAQGNLTAAHVVGPGISLKGFYKQFSDPCNARKNQLTIDLTANSCADVDPIQKAQKAGGFRYNMKFCVLMSVGMNVSSQDLLIGENSNLMFTGLELADDAGPAQPGQAEPARPGFIRIGPAGVPIPG